MTLLSSKKSFVGANVYIGEPDSIVIVFCSLPEADVRRVYEVYSEVTQSAIPVALDRLELACDNQAHKAQRLSLVSRLLKVTGVQMNLELGKPPAKKTTQITGVTGG